MRKESREWALMALVAAAALIVGCAKENNTALHEPGATIVFGASTEWENDLLTRTEYSGKDQNNNTITSGSTYERIDWVAGSDRIRILCDAATGGHVLDGKGDDYTLRDVSVPAGMARKSTAGISPANGNGLKWGSSSDDHYFFAMYPAPGMKSNYGFTDQVVSAANAVLAKVNGTTATITGKIPSEQTAYKVENTSEIEYKPNMNYAYMYAAKKVAAGSTGNVELSFYPLVTTIEFTLLGRTGNLPTANLTRAELSSASTALTGTFTATVTESGVAAGGIPVPTRTEANSKITIDLGTGVALGSTPVKITFLTYPMEQKDLTLTLYFGSDPSNKRSLDLKDSAKATADNPEGWIAVPARKKAYIRNLGVPGEVSWEYHLGDLSAVALTYTGGTADLATDFVSYRSHGSVTEPVAYKLQYCATNSTDDADWSDTPPAEASWFTVSSPASGYDGSVSGESIELEMTAQVNSATDSHEVALKAMTAKSGFDLSKYRPTVSDNNSGGWNNPASSRTTANCYVVKAPGTYKFPLVYGNGVVSGSVNPSAYRAKAGNTATSYRPYNYTTDYLGSFRDYKNQYIYDDRYPAKNSPYLTTHLGKDYDYFIPVLLWTDVPGLIKPSSLSISGSGENTYLNFEVPVETIRQGNAVIGVRTQDDGDAIAWSWHIWVTDEDLSSYGTLNSVYKLPRVNLGWRDRRDDTYAERTFYVRAVQTNSSGLVSEPVAITQSAWTKINDGHSLYYQWGRKDPFPAIFGSWIQPPWMTPSENNKPSDYDELASSGSIQRVDHAVSIGATIQNPTTLYLVSYGDWCTSTFNNLWNSVSKEPGAYTDDSKNSKKTIYDPCPVGFKIPPLDTFRYLTEDNFKLNESRNHPVGRSYSFLFFPLQGYLTSSWATMAMYERHTDYHTNVINEEGHSYTLFFTHPEETDPSYTEKVVRGSHQPRAFPFPVRPIWE